MQMAPPKSAQLFLWISGHLCSLEVHSLVSNCSISWDSIAIGAVALISIVGFKEDLRKKKHDFQKCLKSITLQPLFKWFSHKLTGAPNHSTSVNTISLS